jgi:cob(I)alamin adenosyltransferase
MGWTKFFLGHKHISSGFWTAVVVAAAVAGFASESSAQTIRPYDPTTTPWYMVDEVRVGAYKQAIDNAPHEGGAALNVEALFGRIPGGYENKVLDFFLTPRPQIGTTIAFGKTDEFYWGVAWDYRITDRIFFETTFGGAAHDGPLIEEHEASYGCRVNFKESASLGFALTPEWRLMPTIDHMSNAGLCPKNRGLTNAGLRLGYKF